MKSRFLMLLLGMLLVPAVSRAQIPTADIPGTIQAATEVGNTLNNVKESITQVEQYQKTMSAIGTAKKTVSEFIANQKEKLQEKMEKIQEYKERVEEYKAKAEAYKAEIEDRVNQAKEKIDEAKDKVNEVKEQAEDIKNQVTSTIDGAKDKLNEVKDQAESIKGQVTGAISAAKDKVAGAKEQMDEACADPESEACSQATEAYNQAVTALDAKEQTENSAVASAQAAAAAGMAAEIVDTPVTQPSRQPITGAVAAASAAVETTSAAKASVVKAASAQPLESAATAKAVPAVSQAKAVGTAAKAVSAQATPQKSVSQAASVSGQNTATVKAAAVVSPAAQLKAAPAAASAVAGNTVVKADSAAEKTTATSAISAVKAALTQAAESAAKTKDVSAVSQDVSASEQAVKQDANTAVEAVSPATTLEAAPAVRRPTRATFKTSSGYGFIRQTYPLAFASLSLDIGESQGGVTANNVLVVPESISLECNLNFEDAAEDGQMDACLRSINTKALSRVSEDVSKVEIEDAEKALTNGLAEYMAAAYFEAMNIYNESITFKNNVIDPAITAEVPDVQTAWKYALDVSTSMGTRINDLSRLWSRSLATEAYRMYKEKGLQTK